MISTGLPDRQYARRSLLIERWRQEDNVVHLIGLSVTRSASDQLWSAARANQRIVIDMALTLVRSPKQQMEFGTRE